MFYDLEEQSSICPFLRSMHFPSLGGVRDGGLLRAADGAQSGAVPLHHEGLVRGERPAGPGGPPVIPWIISWVIPGAVPGPG